MNSTTRMRVVGPMMGADNEYVGATGHLAPLPAKRRNHVVLALDEEYAHRWAGRLIEVHNLNLERVMGLGER